MPRYSLTLTDKEVKDLKRLAKKDDRSMASMMRVVFKRGLHVSISASDPRQNDVTSASNQQSPDPARVRESSVLPSFLPDQKEEEGEKEPPATATAPPPDEPEFVRVARAIRELDWLGATLAKGETPEAFADKLLHAFPDVNVLRMVYKASAVLPERNRKKKSMVRQLGAYLLNFMENEYEPPAWKRERREAASKPTQTSLLNGNGQSTAPRHRLPTAEEALEAGRAAFRREQEALARARGAQSELPTGGGSSDE